MSNLATVGFKIFSRGMVGLLLLSGCTDNSEIEKLRAYLGGINAQEAGGPSQLPNLSGPSGGSANAIIGGTPRQVKDGFCGDGIINGTTEDCDQSAIQNTSCRDYGGIAGEVRCQPNTCLYDISDCITPAVDRHIGGVTEACKCNCNTSPCSGGCRPAGGLGQSVCNFKCDQDCVCQCGGKIEAHVEECSFRCACIMDLAGSPSCECSIDDCDLLATISPNIATIATNAIRSGGS